MPYSDYKYVIKKDKALKSASIDLYKYTDYKLYLKDKFYTFPSHGHGIQAKVAEVCSCNPSYISQVLNGAPHLTLEQTVAISDWLGLNKLEGKFFLTLVQKAKAGSQALKKIFQEEAEELRVSSLNIKKRVRSEADLSTDEQATYYSEWSYAAVHVALTVPSLRSTDAIADHFQFPLKKVNKILKFLTSVNLAKQEGDKFFPTKTQLHLASDSVMILRHHSNWRLKAVRSIEEQDGKDLHYSTVVSLSRKDKEKLHGMLLKVIEDFQAVVKPSPEEQLAALNLDFFKL